jgi:hypothetical protein
MPGDHLERFYALFFAGLGLLLAGLVNALRRNQTDRGRVLFAALACGALLGGLWLWEPNPRLLGRSAAFVALVAVPCLLVGSSWLGAAAGRAVGLLRRPTVRWGLIGVAGLGCVVGSVVRYEVEDARLIDATMRDMELLSAAPPLGVVDHTRAATDRGAEVTLKGPTALHPADELLSSERGILDRFPHHDALVRRSPPDEGANCHGWVFAAGRFWVGGSQVEAILSDNGYREVSDPRPDDLVVYRQNREVLHTAVVRYVTPGLPVLVEGKWGWMGVYMHPVERSAYGADFTYYRSRRAGHTLTGIADRNPATPPAE